MTEYATAQDMTDYFGDVEVLRAFDRDADGIVDVGVMTAALIAASTEIDTYLCVRYDLPLQVVASGLMRVCCDLAMYHASIGSDSITEDKQTRYDQRLEWLKMLAKGNVSLGAQEEEVVAQDDVEVASTNPDRLFTRTTQRGLF